MIIMAAEASSGGPDVLSILALCLSGTSLVVAAVMAIRTDRRAGRAEKRADDAEERATAAEERAIAAEAFNLRESRRPQLVWQQLEPEHAGFPMRIEMKSTKDLKRIVVELEWAHGGEDTLAFTGLHPQAVTNALRRPSQQELDALPRRMNATRGPAYVLAGDDVSLGHAMLVNFMTHGGPLPEYGRAVLRCAFWVADEPDPWVEFIDTGRVKLWDGGPASPR